MPIHGPKLENPTTVHDILKIGLETKPNEHALVSLDTKLTWKELDEASSKLAAGYVDHGLEPGDRIASLMPNRVSLYIHYLACFKAGLVVVPLNYRYMSPEIDHALGVSGAKAMLAHAERGEDLNFFQIQSPAWREFAFRRSLVQAVFWRGLSSPFPSRTTGSRFRGHHQRGRLHSNEQSRH